MQDINTNSTSESKWNLDILGTIYPEVRQAFAVIKQHELFYKYLNLGYPEMYLEYVSSLRTTLASLWDHLPLYNYEEIVEVYISEIVYLMSQITPYLQWAKRNRAVKYRTNPSECPICYEKARIQEKWEPCGHVFCQSCIVKYKKEKCPYCKTQWKHPEGLSVLREWILDRYGERRPDTPENEEEQMQ